jgi:DME family drug/metabolite transporter
MVSTIVLSPARSTRAGLPYTTGAMLLGLLLVCLSAVSWGTTGSVMTLLAREGTPSPLLVGWARIAVAAPCLLFAAALARSTSPSAGGWRPRDLGKAALLGAAMAAYQVCYFWAVPRTGVALTALFAICSAPLLIAAGAAVWLKERPSRAARIALLLAVAGTAMVLAGPRADGAVTAKELLRRIAPLPLAALTFTLAAVLLTPVLALERDAPAQLEAGWPLLVYLGVIPTALAYVVFGAGLARVTATAAGIATLLEPLTAAALGVAVFGERLGSMGWAGAALLLAALALLARSGSGNQ